MIVRILSKGKSFAGLAAYLTRDPNAKTADRVAWTHTLNLANDHVACAVDEMLWTSRNAEFLKMEAGIRAGGRSTENAVKHLSLNWSPDDHPTREHMIETTEGFLRHMGWQDHQALLVSHTDRPHPHVHVELNVIHPETGLRLDDDFERRRAQAWALGYEREQGRIHCGQRLLDIGEREDSPTRPVWMAFREKENEFDRGEKMLRDQDPILVGEPKIPEMGRAEEWKILKEYQRSERLEFFAEGKSAFSELRTSVFREVREEFRDRWSDYYAARRDGGDPDHLAETRATLLAEQKTALDGRRDEACAELRKTRDGEYRELLDGQRETRAELHWRQDLGLDNAPFLSDLKARNPGKDMADGFRESALDATSRQDGGGRSEPADDFSFSPREERTGMKSGFDIGAGMGLGLLSFFGGIADGLVASKPAPKPRQQEAAPPGPGAFDAAAHEARNQQQREREQGDDDWYRKQRSLYGE